MAKVILLARILLCAMLTLGTLEMLARLDDHVREGAPFFGRYDTSLLTAQDRLGRILRPISQFARWKINGWGYRGPAPRPGTVRIICLGASETFGIAEDDNREYPRQLEDQLNERFGTRSIEVINLGFPGGNFHETPARIPEIVDRYHPDFVTIYPSPAQYILQRKPSQSHESARQQPPPLRSQIEEKVLRTIKSWLPPRVAVFNRYWGGLTRLGLDDLRIKGKMDGLAVRTLPPAVVAWWRHWFANLQAWHQGWPLMDRLPEETFEIFRDDLVATLKLLDERGVPVVLATHAQRFGDSVAPEERTALVAWRAFYPPLKEDGFLDMDHRLNQVIREVALARGVRMVDAARIIPPGPRYFNDFVHFTNQGAEKMASLLAGQLAPLVTAKLKNRPETRESMKHTTQALSPTN